MERFIEMLEGITEAVGRLVGWFTLVMMLLTLAVALLRYGANIGATAMQESALYLHGAVFTLAAGFALKRDAHVRVDVFYRQLSSRSRHWIDFWGTLVLLFPLTLTIFYYCLDYVLTAWRVQERSVEAGGLALVYVQKSLLLGLCLSLLLQGVCELFHHGRQLFGRELR